MSTSAATPLTLPPLAGLVELLRTNSFMVTTDDYVHLLKIVERYGSEPPHSLALRICPVIAITAEEQERFYHVFGAYMQRQGALGGGITPSGKRWLKWLLISLAILVTVAVNIIALPPRFVEFTGELSGEKVLLPGDLFEDEVVHLGIALGKEKDTVPVRAQWLDSGRSVIGRGARVSHQLTDTGRHIILREITAGPRSILHKVVRQPVYVCPSAVGLSIDGPERVVAGREIRLRAIPKRGGALIRSYDWDTAEMAGTGRVLSRDSASLSLRIDTPGIYTLRCMPVVPTASARCISGASIDLEVVDTGKQYNISFTGSSPPFAPAKTLRKGPWYLLLPLLAAIGYWGFRKDRRKTSPPQQEAKAQAVPPPASDPVLKPPYEVPFPAPAVSDIVMDKPLRRFLQLLRFKAEEEEQQPDIRGSIRATIRAGGMAEMVFKPRRRIQEYLLFIDGSRPQGMMYAMYNHFAQLMEAEGIPATVFYYNADFACSVSGASSQESLRGIADNYPAAIPIILGDGAALMPPFGGAVRSDLLEQWLRWETVLLITPGQRAGWGGRERELSKHFLTAPADASALAVLGQNFKAGRQAKFEPGSEAPQDEPADFKSVAGLRRYLGGDEALFQWLCAICIYPKPRWELMAAFGKAILSRYDREQDVRYDNLLRLCRIPWLAEGSFPQRLRMNLLKALTAENEVAGRTALVALMKSVRTRYAGDYLFSAEQELQETLSRFVLYGHDQTRFAAHATAVVDFRRLLSNGDVTDMPARKYLEGGQESPLRIDGAPASAEQIIQKESDTKSAAAEALLRKARHARQRRMLLSGAAMAALISISAFLGFSEAARTMSTTSWLYNVDSGQLVPIQYTVKRSFAACEDKDTSFRVLPATLRLKDRPVGMVFDAKTQTLTSMGVTLKELYAGASAPQLTLAVSSSAVRLVNLAGHESGGNILISCQREADTPAAKNEFPESTLPYYLNEIWQGTTNNRLLNINLASEMMYYSTGGTDTWGTSRIEKAFAAKIQGKDGYRVVVNVFPGYMVYFLKNVRRGGFSMTFCDERYKTIEEAMKAAPDCKPYDDMRLYYEENTNRIFLPAVLNAGDRQVPVARELEKLRRLVNEGGMDAPGSLIVSYTQQDNGSFLTRGMVSDAAMREFIGNMMQNVSRLTRQPGVVVEKKNPFLRAYLTLRITYGKYQQQPTTPPASGARPGLISPDSLMKLSERNKRRQDALKKRGLKTNGAKKGASPDENPPAAK